MFGLLKSKRTLNPSVINTGVVIKGTLKGEGEINIDGVVDGDVNAEAIIIGLNGKVIGTIKADRVEVYGALEGKILAKDVFLAETARVIGNIHHESLSMEQGAFVEGDFRHKDTK
ncbi:MAG: polymer-forming cytoskeletal protein [Alphaproteobacteria bacterium]|nr:polymer-forming cytoskeletal protein [Alphaproteobacteria bacterium]MBN2779792.1 polymer-forming cytoskeletal protein [Alphaproteobacteria bacterium]